MSVGETTLSGCLFATVDRAYPTPGKAALLARAFGWAQVVFNDALRARQDAHAAGEKVSDTQVQRRVVTLAKTTPARGWLGPLEVGRRHRQQRSMSVGETTLSGCLFA